jgi:hypothetical protein
MASWLPILSLVVVFISGLAVGVVFVELHDPRAWFGFFLGIFGKFLLASLFGWFLRSEWQYIKRWRENHPVEIAIWQHALDGHVGRIKTCDNGLCNLIK